MICSSAEYSLTWYTFRCTPKYNFFITLQLFRFKSAHCWRIGKCEGWSVGTQFLYSTHGNPIQSFVLCLQITQTSLVAQMVKRLPTMRETQVQFLGWEDLLEKEMATHSCILPGKSHGQRSLVDYSPWGRKELDMTERLNFHFLSLQITQLLLR